MYYNFRWIVYSAWLGQFYLPSTILDQIFCFWLTYKILIEALQYYSFLNIAKKRLKDNSLEVDKAPKYLCLSAQFSPTLCDSTDRNLPGPSIHGVFQATVVEWIAVCSSGASSWPRDRTHVSCVSCIGRQMLYHCATWETGG